MKGYLKILLFLPLLASCKRDDFGRLPVVETMAITSITDSTAMSGGVITDDGGRTISGKGICWDTSPNPVTTDNVTYEGSGMGNYTSTMTFLRPGTTYHVRAYATNNTGVGYGNTLIFTTTNFP